MRSYWGERMDGAPEGFYAWRFIECQGSSTAWAWQLVDGDCSSIIKCSEGGFPTLYACIEDAIQHGYVVRDGAHAFQEKRGRR